MKTRTAALVGAATGAVATLALTAGTVALAAGGMHRGMHRMCDSDHRAERIEYVLTEAREELALRPDQQPAYEELAAAITRADGVVDATCAEITGEDRPDDPVEHLARAETMMAAGLQVVQTVRPSFEGFYATLDETQRETLDDFMKSHRRHHHDRHHGDRDG